jgi:hypothetical protein
VKPFIFTKSQIHWIDYRVLNNDCYHFEVKIKEYTSGKIVNKSLFHSWEIYGADQ